MRRGDNKKKTCHLLLFRCMAAADCIQAIACRQCVHINHTHTNTHTYLQCLQIHCEILWFRQQATLLAILNSSSGGGQQCVCACDQCEKEMAIYVCMFVYRAVLKLYGDYSGLYLDLNSISTEIFFYDFSFVLILIERIIVKWLELTLSILSFLTD